MRLNRIVEAILAEQRLIQPGARWYPGRPILVTENDYTLGLFNGDIGILLPGRYAGGGLSAWFFSPSGDLRRFPPARLPEHETVFAMTVHKSQGTEFDRTLFLLPDQDSPVLTRELLYTGLTRARRSVEVWGKEAVFLRGVERRTERSSGLRDILWGAP
jgi:exodeoxyribonuclease V alpha subunit